MSPEPTYDEGTLSKVYDALVRDTGLTYAQATDAVNAMQNRGVLFREREPALPAETGFEATCVNCGDDLASGEEESCGECAADVDPRDAQEAAPQRHEYHPNLFGDDGSCNWISYTVEGRPDEDCGLPADHEVHQQEAAEPELIPCCEHCGCYEGFRTGHDDTCDEGCNDGTAEG